jgi:colanic acid biosynthesis glycosyl transferase WcaI
VNQDIFFLISGAGPYKEKLQQKVSEESMNNIMFIDLQTVAKFNHLLNFVYCHLIIQKEEAADLLLPSKLTNILAVGGLSIITASAGTTLYEVVNKYQMGIVIPPNDESAFYNAILDLANSNILDDGFFNIKQVKLAALNYANQFLKKDFIIDRFLETISI